MLELSFYEKMLVRIFLRKKYDELEYVNPYKEELKIILEKLEEKR